MASSSHQSGLAQQSLELLCSLVAGKSEEFYHANHLVEHDFRDMFLRQLEWHRLASHIDLSNNWVRGILSSELVDDISQMKRVQAANALKLTHETANLIDCLVGSGVNTLSLKGPAWSQQLYGTPVKRQVRDIDLFINVADIKKALGLLIGIGYQCELTESTPEDFLKQYMFLTKDISLYHPQKEVIVELHWRLMNNPMLLPIEFEQMWANRQYVNLGGREIPVPGEIDNLIYIACHGSIAHWARLKWVVDWRQAMSSRSFNWDHAIERIIEIGKLIYFKNACDNTRLWFGSDNLDLPSDMNVMASRYLLEINQRCQLNCCYPSVIGGTVNRLMIAGRSGGIWEEYRRSIGTSLADIKRFRLPRYLFPFYYLLRPFLYVVRKLAFEKARD